MWCPLSEHNLLMSLCSASLRCMHSQPIAAGKAIIQLKKSVVVLQPVLIFVPLGTHTAASGCAHERTSGANQQLTAGSA